ncbi:hypothetical protein EV426DRAFT_576832 [Tirmania nivea]|nr:hypothetical protein EV426DRAFT_576832 [Tirmania nivea]
MEVYRSKGRNVHIYLEDEPIPIGGLRLDVDALHITHANFYHFAEILVVPVQPLQTVNRLLYVVSRDTSVPILCDGALLQPGSYLVRATCPSIVLRVNDEPYINRIIPPSVTLRDDNFRDRLRARDAGCAISGKRNRFAHLGIWAGFVAARVWPLPDSVSPGARRLISDVEPSDRAHGGRMNSPQNGMILDSSVHALFDKNLIGVDPDDGYKVFVFGPDCNSVAGRCLSPSARENGVYGVRNSLLRWQLRQCVFANMRGDGEPLHEFDDTTEGIFSRVVLMQSLDRKVMG